VQSEEEIKNRTICVFSYNKLGVFFLLKLVRMEREGREKKEGDEGGLGFD